MSPDLNATEEQKQKFYIGWYLDMISIQRPDLYEKERERLSKEIEEINKIIEEKERIKEQERLEARSKTLWGRILNFFNL